MTTISFSDSDLLRNKIIEPGWYLLDIQGYRTWTPTKDGQSNNCHYECVVKQNADTGDTTYAGCPIELQFNDKPKARGFLEGFLRGLGEEVVANKRYELEAAVGRKIEAFIENDPFNGRVINRVNHKYRVVRK